MMTPRPFPAVSDEIRRKPMALYTDEELVKKNRYCAKDCSECTWLHGCAYGQEIQRRGIVIERNTHAKRRGRR